MQSLNFILGIAFAFTFACNPVNSKDHLGAMKNDSFMLLDASSQNWTAGTPGGGSGTEYYFNVKISTAKQLQFDSAWIDNKSFPIFLSKDQSGISSKPITFSNGDTITLRASALVNPNIKSSTSKPPINYTGAALISYKVKDKLAYYIIKEIVTKPTLNHQ